MLLLDGSQGINEDEDVLRPSADDHVVEHDLILEKVESLMNEWSRLADMHPECRALPFVDARNGDKFLDMPFHPYPTQQWSAMHHFALTFTVFVDKAQHNDPVATLMFRRKDKRWQPDFEQTEYNSNSSSAIDRKARVWRCKKVVDILRQSMALLQQAACNKQDLGVLGLLEVLRFLRGHNTNCTTSIRLKAGTTALYKLREQKEEIMFRTHGQHEWRHSLLRKSLFWNLHTDESAIHTDVLMNALPANVWV